MSQWVMNDRFAMVAECPLHPPKATGSLPRTVRRYGPSVTDLPIWA